MKLEEIVGDKQAELEVIGLLQDLETLFCRKSPITPNKKPDNQIL